MDDTDEERFEELVERDEDWMIETLNKDAGISTCPICGKTWTVTLWQDCALPTCGCYGHDTSAANRQRSCEACGIKHALSCDKMPGLGYGA